MYLYRRFKIFTKGKNMTKFIITGNDRSGVTLLKESINNHSDIICFPELLSMNEESRIIHNHKCFKNGKWLKNKNNVIEYLKENIFDTLYNTGIKITIKQIFKWNILEYLSNIPDLKIIFVKRNYLASYISLIKSNNNKIWSVSDHTSMSKSQPVELDIDNFLSYMKTFNTMENIVIQELSNNYIILYRDLIENYNKIMHKVFDFLMIPSTLKFPPTKLLYNFNIKEDILNWKDVKKKMKDYYPELLEDLF